MDDHVLRGMAKWPNVPAVYGWLELDRRGQWLIKGERIDNPLIASFIGRNYERDTDGNWFFQNGPQRVYVKLEYTPLVFRTMRPAGEPLELVAHTGAAPLDFRGAWLDEHGSIIIDTDLGAGLVDDRDLDVIAAAFRGPGGDPLDDDALDACIERAQRGDEPALRIEFAGTQVPVLATQSAETAGRFGYHAEPIPPAGHPECS